MIAFFAMTVWWLTQDSRVPDWDSSTHMLDSIVIHSELITGHISAPFTDFNSYPPLVHFVGAISVFLAGIHPMAMILTSNVVFVPLLAFGCYGTGRIAFGPRAGVLAAIFALGTPTFASMMHEFDLDPPQTALVAVSVWALLASRRFERVGISALAGALCGLALMTKETSAIFLAGILAVIILRGGWRRWLGLLVFVFVLENVAAPWYIYHWEQLRGTFQSIGELVPSSLQGPPRFSGESITWYFWNVLNEQIFAPFLLAFAIGTVLAIRQCLHRRLLPSNVLPELLVGGAFSYVGMTYLIHKDPRYTLPALVYVAVLSTGWIATIPCVRLRTALSAGVIAIALTNFVAVSTGIGGPVRIKLPARRTRSYSSARSLFTPTSAGFAAARVTTGRRWR